MLVQRLCILCWICNLFSLLQLCNFVHNLLETLLPLQKHGNSNQIQNTWHIKSLFINNDTPFGTFGKPNMHPTLPMA
jgi:hypothetical protein